MSATARRRLRERPVCNTLQESLEAIFPFPVT